MKKYLVGLIGWPLGYSLSSVIHNAAFQHIGMEDWEYQSIPVAPENLKTELNRLEAQGYIGLNITIPYKNKILSLIRPDEEVLKIGAANTLLFPDRRAFNTDKSGFLDDLKSKGILLKGQKSLVLGIGGAAQAAIYGLMEEGSEVMVLARTPSKAHSLLKERGWSASIIDGFENIPVKEISLIVNCTPVGMWPQKEECIWPEHVAFPDNATVYDMVYRPLSTKLLERAKKQGCFTIGGSGMLLRQGAKAFEIWTGQKAPLEVMEKALKNVLEKDL